MLSPLTLAAAMPAIAAGTLYGAAAMRLRDHRVPWPRARTAAFLGGAAILAVAVVVPGVVGGGTTPAST